MFGKNKKAIKVINYCETQVRNDLSLKCKDPEMRVMVKDIYLKHVDYTMNFQRRRWTQVTVFMGLVTAVVAIMLKLYEKESQLTVGIVGIICSGLLASWARMFLHTSNEMLMHFAMLRELETYLPTNIYEWDRDLYKLLKHPSNTKMERDLAVTVLLVLLIVSLWLIFSSPDSLCTALCTG